MPINLVFPSASSETIANISEIIDFLAIDATITAFSSTSFSGAGFYNGQSATFTATGTGFVVTSDEVGDYISAGSLNSISMSVNGVNVASFTDLGFDMAVFAPIILADDSGIDPFAIENFLMSQDWNITTSDLDNVLPAGTFVGDGVAFNLIGNDSIDAGAGNDNLFTGDGNDTMRGEGGNDTLDGGEGNDRLYGRADRDLLLGQDGFDRLFGGSARDTLNGGADDDDLFGGKGRDRLEGGTGNDSLDGDGGHDNLFGNSGNDTLNGGAGNDRLTGGNNADTFVFEDGFGNDTIIDFSATNNSEDIDLSGVTAITDYADLLANHIDDSSGTVIIDDGAGNTITLNGITSVGQLDSGDFIF